MLFQIYDQYMGFRIYIIAIQLTYIIYDYIKWHYFIFFSTFSNNVPMLSLNDKSELLSKAVQFNYFATACPLMKFVYILGNNRF